MIFDDCNDDDDDCLLTAGTWVNLVVGLGKRLKGNVVPLTQSAVISAPES